MSTLSKFFSILAIIFSSYLFSQTSTELWNLSDVSVLMPLPRGEENNLLKTTTLGLGGELFPNEFLASIGPLSVPSARGSKLSGDLRAIAFRFDPCPAKPKNVVGCFPEIRIVWQPVYQTQEDPSLWTTEDVSIHSFYSLNKKQYQNYKNKILEIKKVIEKKYKITTNNKALDIHPAFFSKEAGVYFQNSFQQLIIQVLGKENLYKFTVMKLLVEQNWWKFLPAKEKNAEGKWERAQIADHGGFEMDIINDATKINPLTGHVDEVDASIFILPAFPKEDDIRRIVSSGFRSTMYATEPNVNDLEPFKVVLKNVLSFQNPKLSNPHTINCVNCHYADTAIKFAEKTFPELKKYTLSLSTAYKNPNPKIYNVSNNTVALKSSRVVRAFGYFGDQVSIMNRTIFDSIESAHFLNNESYKK